MTRTKKIALSCIVVLFLLGIGIMVYPFASSWYAERVRSEIHYQYAELVQDQQRAELIRQMVSSALDYNHKLYTGEISPLEPEENGYWEQLSFEESEMMCYIRIPVLDVELPVYHGIGEEDLRRGAGHMPQTSLPIGGDNTHCVISAHSGMASDPMFTDIGLLKEGDLVYIDILDRTLTYEVYGEHEIVLPHAVERIKILEGEDLLTLVTCTPINVNSHRLLVHCRRVEEERTKPQQNTVDMSQDFTSTQTDPIAPTFTSEPAAQEQDAKETGSIYLQAYRQNLLLGIALGLALMLMLFLVWILLRKRRDSQRNQP